MYTHANMGTNTRLSLVNISTRVLTVTGGSTDGHSETIRVPFQDYETLKNTLYEFIPKLSLSIQFTSAAFVTKNLGRSDVSMLLYFYIK